MSTLQVRFSPYLGSASSRPSQKVDLGAVRYLHSVVKRCSSKGRPAPRERSLHLKRSQRWLESEPRTFSIKTQLTGASGSIPHERAIIVLVSGAASSMAKRQLDPSLKRSRLFHKFRELLGISLWSSR